MKKITGALIILLSIAFVTILILKIWGIEIVSLDFLLRGALSLVLTGTLLLALILFYGYFFKSQTKGYDMKKGNKAHPKI